ncbi:poly(A) polymerase [Leptothrix ochracea L12]|uniref:Poly(A) polymerase I n=1 Tax=Leptothrix ochracea L12 TaxID=735332 RepID=I4Z547_9BURK|nr:polynucleotide adenylyltransferase PcnB [Leptothrix ochracea]EIM31339.1 poly(A) polymerase [Leptothrix ochracea L12]
MIKKFISTLFRRSKAAAPVPAPELAPPESVTGRRVEVPFEKHRIDPALIDERATRVVSTLQEAGFEAYIVGGAVRDLLLGHRPKDFDVATNATPAQVKALFRRAFIIGRRFQLVHVVFGRGREHEVIEVSTFRALMEPAEVAPVRGNERTSKAELVGKSHAVDASGRVLRDNVWGPQDEDAARRDFTINALYYDPARQVVIDYHHGIEDAAKRVLRMIGDPSARFREDPVRIIRVVRFAAKLGFEIEPHTRAPMRKMADLLANVPASRVFDEMIKLLQTGHALASLEELRKQGLHRGLFPILDAVLDAAHQHNGREKFIQLALNDTDRRVAEGKPVAPSFMLACMLWHDVLHRWDEIRAATGAPLMPALQEAVDAVFDARIGDISGRGKLGLDMREMWLMQPRFERRQFAAAVTLVEQPRFRAGFDFLRLRGQAGEIDPELSQWWEAFSLADDDERRELVEQYRRDEQARRAAAGPEAAASSEAAAPKRRRRRKPSGGAGAPVSASTLVIADASALGDQAEAPIGPDVSIDSALKPRPIRRRRRPAKDDAGVAVVVGETPPGSSSGS